MASKVKDRIKEKLKNARKVTLTTDAWSAKNSRHSQLGATAHYFNQLTRKIECLKIGKFIVSRFGPLVSQSCSVLACREFDVSHTGANIASMLEDIMEEYEIVDKVWAVITDGAPSMAKGLSCIFHPNYFFKF